MSEVQQGLRIGITIGEPAGIGPEIVSRALAKGIAGASLVRVYGDTAMLAAAADAAGLRGPAALPATGGAGTTPGRTTLGATHVELRSTATHPVLPGAPDPRAAHGVVEAIRAATRDCLAGELDALVTGPIAKDVLGRAGYAYPGHTELLAELCGGAPAVMLLAGGRLRVVPATIHCALREVPERIAALDWAQLFRVLSGDLARSFGIARPRIALCGLNPHASDGGRFGDEEARVLEPAARAARAAGIDVRGPLAADSVFTRALAGEFDCVVGTYHDQVLGPLKLHAFGRAVNVTLGLPIVRTSVDHGTAFDIAGRGRADPGSLEEAIRMALEIAARRKQSQ